MAGQLTIDAHLAGNGTTPQIDGTVKLTEGSLPITGAASTD